MYRYLHGLIFGTDRDWFPCCELLWGVVIDPKHHMQLIPARCHKHPQTCFHISHAMLLKKSLFKDVIYIYTVHPYCIYIYIIYTYLKLAMFKCINNRFFLFCNPTGLLLVRILGQMSLRIPGEHRLPHESKPCPKSWKMAFKLGFYDYPWSIYG